MLLPWFALRDSSWLRPHYPNARLAVAPHVLTMALESLRLKIDILLFLGSRYFRCMSAWLVFRLVIPSRGILESCLKRVEDILIDCRDR
jgi:hypothetical protein